MVSVSGRSGKTAHNKGVDALSKISTNIAPPGCARFLGPSAKEMSYGTDQIRGTASYILTVERVTAHSPVGEIDFGREP
jgi:hypothetical protein